MANILDTITIGNTKIIVVDGDPTGLTISMGSLAIRNDGGGFYYNYSGTTASWIRTVDSSTSSTVTIIDNLFTIQDNGDTTKQLQFDLSNISSGVTRTLNIPNINGVITALGNTASGSGNIILQTTPTLITPILGVATASSINGLSISTTTGTLTIANGKTFISNNSLTLSGTDGNTISFGTGGTAAYVSNNLSVFASTTSDQLAGVISDETGTASLVFSNTPTLITPVLGVASSTSETISGTGGNGYLQLSNQTTAPSLPITSIRLFADTSNRFSWKGTNGFVRTLDGTSNTADRIYILPNIGGNIMLADGGQSITSATWSATPISILFGGTGQTTKTLAFDALSPNTTKGDITVYSGTSSTRFPIGLTGQSLISDSTQSLGVKWVNSYVDIQTTATSSAITTTSLTFVDTGLTLTTKNLGENGSYLITFTAEMTNTNNGRIGGIQIVVDGVVVIGSIITTEIGTVANSISTSSVVSNLSSGKIIKIQWNTSANTATMNSRSLNIIGYPNNRIAP